MSKAKPRRRITTADWRTIAFALNLAIDERDSFAAAYGYKGPEAKDAMDAVARFEALHQKLFGRQSRTKDLADQMAKMERVSIFELLSAKDES